MILLAVDVEIIGLLFSSTRKSNVDFNCEQLSMSRSFHTIFHVAFSSNPYHESFMLSSFIIQKILSISEGASFLLLSSKHNDVV